MKPRIKEVIIVEGKCDLNAVKSAVDATVIETRGFGIFKDAEKREIIRVLCRARGVIVLTDSDGAGFLIRGHLRSFLPPEGVKQAYIPQIAGKERRKILPSKAGFLGVEGMEAEVIRQAIFAAGATQEGAEGAAPAREKLTKADLYALGLSGRPDSAKRRAEVLKKCGLPAGLSTNALLEAVNILFSKKQFMEVCAGGGDG